MGEWLKPAVLKTVSPERGSGVRIPLPPPTYFRVPIKPVPMPYAASKNILSVDLDAD